MESLIYLYGLIPTEEVSKQQISSNKSFDGKGHMYTLTIGKATAVVCDLDAEQYSEESIKEQINNDMEWLQEKAFHHHETVMMLSKMYTVVPLKFCTLFKNQASLENAVQTKEAHLSDTFASIHGNEEWNLKIYCDDQLLKEQVSESNPAIEARREEISQLTKGKQFFEKKKLDKLIESELEEEKNRISENIHGHLSEIALKGNVKKTWSNDVTGRKDEMTWNSVYLIPAADVENFLGQIQQYEKDMKGMGWQFEATGPWPAYHFSNFS